MKSATVACRCAWALFLVASAACCASDRVEALLRRMTLEEKITLVHGAAEPSQTGLGQAGYWPGLPRLGIPPLRLTDGPPGVLVRIPSTGMTATMGLAATFSRADAFANGEIIGEDARALGQDVVLEPYINIHRDQTFERAYNTFGEDPFLTGEIAAAQIKGTQQQGVMAQAKHYVAYDGADDVTVDEQALHEIYVAPFAAAVAAGVSSIMCSYNRVNGAYSCGNGSTLNGILKGELHFAGFVTSDWGAVHDTLFVNRGLDLEMPGMRLGNLLSYLDAQPAEASPSQPRSAHDPQEGVLPEEAPRAVLPAAFNLPPPSIGLLAAVSRGQVTEATLTRSVRRILGQLDRFGYLDHPPSHLVVPQRTQEHAAALRKTAEDAAVLLKNDHALPLDEADRQSLVLIGPGAGQLIAVGSSGEKALGHLERQVSPLKALQQSANVSFAVANDMTGAAVPAEYLTHEGTTGLRHEQDAAANATATDATVDFTVLRGTALPPRSRHRWTGELRIPVTGDYDLSLQLLGAHGSFSLDRKKAAGAKDLGLHGDILQPGEDNVLPTTDGLDNIRRRLHLDAGTHAIAVDVVGDDGDQPLQCRLAWITPDQRLAAYSAAVTAARRAHTAVVFAWSRGSPAFGLPGDQDRLIEEVAAVNAHTIVVLNTSEPTAMPWLAHVRAVLQMWYPGDEGGWATANLLLGRVSPGGRLPFTWPERLSDELAHHPAHPERSSTGLNGHTRYGEGLDVGYRWYDRNQLTPLFPFGFGLSYTSFEYSDLKTKTDTEGATVRFKLRNQGRVPGDEVAQVYVGPPRTGHPDAQFAVRSLAAFERVHLEPGESRELTLRIPLRQLQYWSVSRHRWTEARDRDVYVGASSRDVRLSRSL
jgi:beta-glucosidase